MKIKAPKIGYYLKLAFNGIIKNPVMTMSSIFVLLSCLVIMGSFYLVIKNVNYNVNKIDGYNKIVLFIERDATEYEVLEIGEKLKGIKGIESAVLDYEVFDNEEVFYDTVKEVKEEIESNYDKTYLNDWLKYLKKHGMTSS